MKTKLVLLFLFFSGVAQAQDYLCPGGTRITYRSRSQVIHATIENVAMECRLTATGPDARLCSIDSTTPSCAEQPAFSSDCRMDYNANGKCYATEKLGSDGNAICGCAVGE